MDVAVGVLALVVAFTLQRIHRRRELKEALRETPKQKSRSHDRLERLVEKGGPLAFAGGVVGSAVPGPLVILGMADIAQLGYSTVATLIVILCFSVIVFAFIEVPIGGFVVAPERTKATTVSVKSWLDRNLFALAAWALAIVGAYQVVRGIVTALV